MGLGGEESGGGELSFSPSAPLHGCSGPGRQETQPDVPLACPRLEASPTTARLIGADQPVSCLQCPASVEGFI